MLDVDDPAFSIHTDRARKLIDISVRGHWNNATMDRFERHMRDFLVVFNHVVCPSGERVTIFDLTGFSVQSPKVLIRIAAMVQDKSIASRSVAILLSSMLLRMQARRIAPSYGVFATRGEAIAWLFPAASQDGAV